MTPNPNPSGDGRRTEIRDTDEVARVSDQIAARLEARGVTVSNTDTSDDLGTLLEAVEAFEIAVEAAGGDLMVDEAPAGEAPEPDNPAFVLPKRGGSENAGDYATRIRRAATSLRR